mmetsp:Transcript_10174/g.29654  ORF Transcript_10174/g.29654 Transcript_10174/m.29654 type:complete len:94 (+) Transcript_10174:621-902(+)
MLYPVLIPESSGRIMNRRCAYAIMYQRCACIIMIALSAAFGPHKHLHITCIITRATRVTLFHVVYTGDGVVRAYCNTPLREIEIAQTTNDACH